MTFDLPDFALVVIFGPEAGATAEFAARHFGSGAFVAAAPERLSAEANGEVSESSWQVSRLLAGRSLAVVDASSLSRDMRRALVLQAKKYHSPLIALVFATPPASQQRDGKTPLTSTRKLQRDGFRDIRIVPMNETLNDLEVTLTPLSVDCRAEHGPFDIIGDLHGCYEEVCILLDRLGYRLNKSLTPNGLIGGGHPEGRQAIFLGDLTDRGPRSLDCIRLVMGLCEARAARCVIGNHDNKLRRALEGRRIRIDRELAQTMAELETAPADLSDRITTFLENLPSHLWFASGKLAIAHAGLNQSMIGRDSDEVRSFAMFGDTTGKFDEFGLPERIDWSQTYRGNTTIIYGHTPRHEARWFNRTLCIDTGCVFGGRLTALRWPENKIVTVPALRKYAHPKKPLEARHC